MRRRRRWGGIVRSRWVPCGCVWSLCLGIRRFRWREVASSVCVSRDPSLIAGKVSYRFCAQDLGCGENATLTCLVQTTRTDGHAIWQFDHLRTVVTIH